jgi:predicted PurR-regulated permease PerM
MWLHRRVRFPWSIACLTVVFGLVVVNLLVTAGFALAVPKLLQGLPPAGDNTAQLAMYKKFRARVESISPWALDEKLLPENPRDINEIRGFHYITDAVQKSVPQILWYLTTYISRYLWQWILIMFILLFLLLEGRMLIRRVVEIFGPSPEVQSKARQVMSDMAHHIRTYLVWRTLVNIGVAMFVGAVYHWAGLSQAWLWAIITAVLFYIPYIGPIIAGVPPVVDAFLSSSVPAAALAILAFYLIVTVLEGYVIVPVVMGRSMELNATTVMLACLFWELVWGPVGLFLAMPLMAAVKTICFHVPGWRPWANLMSITEVEPEGLKLESTTPELLFGAKHPGVHSDKVETGITGDLSQIERL